MSPSALQKVFDFEDDVLNLGFNTSKHTLCTLLSCSTIPMFPVHCLHHTSNNIILSYHASKKACHEEAQLS